MNPLSALLLALCCLQAATISSWAKSLASNSLSTAFCSKQTNGQVYCWGWNNYRMFGVGSLATAYHAVPVQMLNVVSASDVDMSGYFACIVDQGQVRCAGYGKYIGRGATDENSAVLVRLEGVDANTVVSQVIIADQHACLLTDSGLVWCWGNGAWGQLANPSKPIYPTAIRVTGYGSNNKTVEVALGTLHTCILLSDGTVGCAGRNYEGQLGTGMVPDSHEMVKVRGGLSDVVSISAGDHHTCAVTRSGKVSCWGKGNRNQLGTGFLNLSQRYVFATHSCLFVANSALSPPNSLPVVVRGVPKAASVTCGRDATFVFTQSGRSLVAFGYSNHGALVFGKTRALEKPTTLYGGQRGIREVAGGHYAACIQLDDGVIKCIGSHGQGQLGRDLPIHDDLKKLGLVADLPLTQAPTPKPTKRPTQYPTSKYPTAKPTKRPTQYPTKKTG